MDKKIVGIKEGQERLLDHLIEKEETAAHRFEKALEAFERARSEGRKVTKEESKEMADSYFDVMNALDKTQERLVKMGRAKN